MPRPLRSARLLVPVATAAVAGALLIAVPPASAAGNLTATLGTSSVWDTGWVGTLVVGNTGNAPVTGWRVEFDLPANQGVTDAWNARLTRSGNHYTLTDDGWNATVNPGAQVQAGMDGTGPRMAPANCTVNGAPCGGGGPTTTPPTTTPPTTTPPTTTPPTTTPPTNNGPFNKVAYFAQWGIYGRAFFLRNVETSGAAGKLTAINYAFSNVTNGQCATGDSFADWDKAFPADQSVDGVADTFDQPLRGNLGQLKKLKARHSGLQAMISLGGWTWSRSFSDVALTDASRRAFVTSCIDLWIRGNLPTGAGVAAGVFDGIDIDWEWPASEGNAGNVIRPEDKTNFGLLLAEFRRQLNALGSQTGRRYRLTAFLPADPAKISVGIDVGPVFTALDAGLIQGYDFHGAWEARTGHQSNLFNAPGDPSPVAFSVNTAIQAYRSRGAPAAKLVVGLPAYGRGWQGVGSANNGLFQPGSTGPGTFEQGVDDYKVVVNKPGTRFRDNATGAVWLYDGNQWWTYDDPQLITQKAGYVKSNGLGGLMMWSLDGDTAQAALVSAMDSGLR